VGRQAVAYHARGNLIPGQPNGAPTPCGVTTGYPTAENTIQVGATGQNEGTLFQAAAILNVGPVTPPGIGADPVTLAGVAISANKGLTWNGVCPAPQGMPCPLPSHQDDQSYMDRDTGRYFWNFMPASEGGTDVAWTDDGGATWGLTQAWPFPATENPQVLSGYAPDGQPESQGYPKVVYFCGNFGLIGGAASQGDIALDLTPAPVRTPASRMCEKSLDGGKAFTALGQGLLFSRPVAQHPECGSAPDENSGYPAAATDGTLYLVVTCGGKTYLAHSTDEGATWPIVSSTEAPPATGLFGGLLYIDSANNMYLPWEDHPSNPITGSPPTQLNLSISRDLGDHWTTLEDVGAPGVTVSTVAFGIGAPGQIVFSYYGQVTGQGSADGYLTYSADVLESNPVFWAAPLNPSNQPLLPAGGAGSFIVPQPSDAGDRTDYIGAAIGPDGTPWASFARYCGPDPTAPECLAKEPNSTSRTTVGFVGHLKLATKR
jgi:hypothetical protein